MTTGATHSSPATTPASVAIVLVNWNNWQDCTQCIDSLLGMDYPNFQIFVVDNDSRDDSVEHIHQWCANPTRDGTTPDSGVQRWTDQPPSRPVECRIINAGDTTSAQSAIGCRVTLVRAGGNSGFAGGCNIGIRCASIDRFEFFWFLNTDTAVDRQALAALVARARRDDRPGMVGSTVLYYDRPETVQALAGARLSITSGESRHLGEGIQRSAIPADPTEVEQQLAYVFGASMLVSSELIRTIGLMQEDYFLYYEEMDWAMRSRNQYCFGYAPDSLVFHKSGGSSSRTMPLFTANLFYRNRIRFISRFLPTCLPAARRQLWSVLLRSLIKLRWSEVWLLLSILRDARQIAEDATRHQPRIQLP